MIRVGTGRNAALNTRRTFVKTLNYRFWNLRKVPSPCTQGFFFAQSTEDTHPVYIYIWNYCSFRRMV